MATNTLFRRVSVDTSNDEQLARRLQEQENRIARGDMNTSRSFATRGGHVSRSRTIREDNDGNDSVILLDSSDDSPTLTETNRPSRRPAQVKSTDTSKDEELARQLQAEFDRERVRQSTATATATSRPATRNRTPVRAERRLTSPSFYRPPSMQFGNASRTTDGVNHHSPTRPIPNILRTVRSRQHSPYQDWLVNDLMNIVATETTTASRAAPRGISTSRTATTNRMNTRPDDTLTRALDFFNRPTMRAGYLDDFMGESDGRDEPLTRLPGFTRSWRPQARTSRLGFNFLSNPLGDRDLGSNDYENLLRLDENTVSRGLAKNELASLPTFEFKGGDSENNTCSICIDDFKPKEKLTALACSHKFHNDCIKTWLKEKRRCPLCQKDAYTGE